MVTEKGVVRDTVELNVGGGVEHRILRHTSAMTQFVYLHGTQGANLTAE